MSGTEAWYAARRPGGVPGGDATYNRRACLCTDSDKGTTRLCCYAPATNSPRYAGYAPTRQP
eukprot:281877-Rhodomonas_salina.1